MMKMAQIDKGEEALEKTYHSTNHRERINRATESEAEEQGTIL